MKKHEPYTTPEHLRLLGMEVCIECGKLMSIDNSRCYNCGFSDEDDEELHEEMMNKKYTRIDGLRKVPYMVRLKPGGYYYNRHVKYHIQVYSGTLCGAIKIGETQYEQPLTDSFYNNHKSEICANCLKRFNQSGMAS